MRAHYLLSKPGELAHCLQSRQSVKSCSRHYLCFLIAGADPTRRFILHEGWKKVTWNENADDEFKEGGNVGSVEVRLGSAEVGCAWGRGRGRGSGRAAPVFPPGTCFVKSSLFISQSDYKRRSIFRFCGDSEAFGKPLLYQTAANPVPPRIIMTNEAQIQQIC